MALKKPTPAFEQEPTTSVETSVAEKAAPAAPVTPEPTPDAAAKTTATVAVAKAAGSSVATLNEAANVAKMFKKEVEAMKGAADFSFGSHRVFKADNGVIKEMAGDKLVLGRWVKVRLLACDTSFQVSPGEQGKDSGVYVGYSKDGVTLDSVSGEELKTWEGKPIDEYLTFLRDVEEFDKASKREFIDCQVAVLGCEDEPEFTGVVQITLSSSSIPAFKKYQTDLEATAKCVAMGLPGYSLPADPFTFFFIRENAQKNSNTWTKLKITSTLPAKI